MAMVQMQGVHPFTESTPLLERPAELRRRAQEDGYVYFRGLIPRQDVLAQRATVLAHCRGAGWVDDSAPLLQGIARPGLPPVVEGQSEAWDRFYRLLYTRRELHALNQHPRMMAACAALFGEPVLAHARLIVRVMFPGANRFTTPPHQDHFYIGGTPNTWTAWVPLGDCPEELGGLAIAPGTHLQGPLPVHAAEGAGGHAVPVRDFDWVGGSYAAGDVVLFHSHTIHQGRDNQTADRLRLSCDFRYQPLSEPVRHDSLQPHMGNEGFDWDYVYAGWAAQDPLRFYWKQLPVQLV